MANREQVDKIYQLLNYKTHTREALQNYFASLQEAKILIDLSGADLSAADFRKCNFEGANLNDARIGGMSSCSLKGAKAQGANIGGLSWSDLTGIDAQRLRVSLIDRTNLSDGNFIGAVFNHPMGNRAESFVNTIVSKNSQFDEQAPFSLKVAFGKAREFSSGYAQLTGRYGERFKINPTLIGQLGEVRDFAAEEINEVDAVGNIILKPSVEMTGEASQVLEQQQQQRG